MARRALIAKGREVAERAPDDQEGAARLRGRRMAKRALIVRRTLSDEEGTG